MKGSKAGPESARDQRMLRRLDASRGGFPKMSIWAFIFCFGTLRRRLAAFRPGRSGSHRGADRRRRRSGGPATFLGSHSDARYHRRGVLRAAGQARCQRCADLYRHDPQHENLRSTACRGAKVRAGFRPGGLLSVRQDPGENELDQVLADHFAALERAKAWPAKCVFSCSPNRSSGVKLLRRVFQ